MTCPQCKAEIKETRCKAIRDELAELNALRADLEVQALKEAKNQGLDKDKRLAGASDPEAALKSIAMHACAFYECNDCNKPYFGGMVDCQR